MSAEPQGPNQSRRRRRGRPAARPLVPAPFPRAGPRRPAEAFAHRPGPHRRQARRGQGSRRARPDHPPAARRHGGAATQAARDPDRVGPRRPGDPRPGHPQGRPGHRAEQAAGPGGAGRDRDRAACRRHARRAALRLRGAAAAGPPPGQGHVGPAADRPHRPGGPAPGRLLPRPRDREALLGGRRRHAAAAGRAPSTCRWPSGRARATAS